MPIVIPVSGDGADAIMPVDALALADCLKWHKLGGCTTKIVETVIDVNELCGIAQRLYVEAIKVAAQIRESRQPPPAPELPTLQVELWSSSMAEQAAVNR
jgi:hypothetical protein